MAKAKTQSYHSPYTKTAIGLHWTVGVLILALLTLGWLLAHDYIPDQSKMQWIGLHKEFGMVVLLLAAFRLSWRFRHPAPGHVPMPKWMKLAAEAAHYSLYVLMFEMPLTGWLMSSAGSHPVNFFGLFTVPDLIGPNPELGKQIFMLHMYGMWALFIILTAHIGAALYHHVIRRDDILRRMLPFLSKI